MFRRLHDGYFVGTALTTVRPPSPWTRPINVAGLMVAVGLALGAIASGVKAVNNPGFSPGGVPFRTIFSIRERVATILPEPFTTAPMRTLPFLLLFGAMFYWLWRLRTHHTLPVLVRHDSMPLDSGVPR